MLGDRVTELDEYVARAKESLYFSGAKADIHLRAFLDNQAEACEAIGRTELTNTHHLYLVGSGGSYAALQTAKYVLDSFFEQPIDVLPSYELVWRAPHRLGPSSLVFLASYSGETEDTLRALRCARERGARTVAIVGTPESAMAREADIAIAYNSGAIFEVPILALILAAGAATEQSTHSIVRDLRAGIDLLPEVLTQILSVEKERAEQRARDWLPAQHAYVLGTGPLAPLAYKLAMSVVMENVRIGATFSDACEWRHGPAEAMERMRGDFIVLLGTDESREMCLRTVDFCRTRGSSVMVYDAEEYGSLHPLLVPLVMNSVTQWFIVYSAILRGITDLDDRVFMGRHVLAEGGARWP
jgi:fructoselysine-6-P-deglycase FrlB-like protein